MIGRRGFLKLSGAGGLMVMVGSACKGDSDTPAKQPPQTPPVVPVKDSSENSASVKAPPVASEGGAQVSAWLHIADNDVITYFVPEAEMGQGVHTAVALVIGAELGGAWKYARATTAPVNVVAFGWQSTGGSTSMRKGFAAIRKAGAMARTLLIAAGAEAMGVAVSECEARESEVVWTKGDKRVRFGEVAVAAAKLELKEEEVTLRSELSVGKAVKRLDSFAKVTGQAKYGMDVQIPGMLIAKVLHSPSVGGRIRKIDSSKTKGLSGVKEVVQLSSGVAVLAEHTWAAMQGKQALQVTWDEPHRDLSDAVIESKMRRALVGGSSAFSKGDAKTALAKANTVLEAEYSAPYLAHAPMEPLSCTVQIQNGKCEIWTGTQGPSGLVPMAAKITGLPPSAVFVHGHFLGGGFGRRSKDDFVAEAVELAHKSGKTVKLIWDREDDIRGYQYRPAALHQFKAAIDKDKGKLVAWDHAIASPSILKQFGPLLTGIDGTSVDGVVHYGVPHMSVRYSDVDLPIPVWFWRSVGHSQNCFAVEGFMNECALAAGRDPLEFRLENALVRMDDKGGTEDNPRLRKVLEVAAEKAQWGRALPEGMARGIAVSESFGSFVAQVAEVSLEKGRPKVHRIVSVIDCGQVVNPLTIEAQMDSSVAFGLSAALYGRISFDKGRVLQGNFDSIPIVRMREMPKVETTIITSTEAPGGVGEPAVPPVAAALLGGLLALEGTPRRDLPLLPTPV